MTSAEVAEWAADKVKIVVTAPVTPKQHKSDEGNDIMVPNTPQFAGESQGGTNITLAIRNPRAPPRAPISSPSGGI
jgi:hypothetical protein